MNDGFDSRIIAAIDILQACIFTRGREPTPRDGVYVHQAYFAFHRPRVESCTYHLFVDRDIPLTAVAESVRTGVLCATIKQERLVFQASSEFVAPYSATIAGLRERLAKLESENKSLREAAEPNAHVHNPGPSFGDLCDPEFIMGDDKP